MYTNLIYLFVFLVLFNYSKSVCERNCTNCIILNENTSNSSFVPFASSNLTIVIELRGNPSTGFGWFYAENLQSNSSLNIQALNINDRKSTNEFYLDNVGKLAFGVRGTYCFKFLLKAFQTVKVTFDYYQPWNKNSSLVNSKTFTFGFSKAIILTEFNNVTVSINSNQTSSNSNQP